MSDEKTQAQLEINSTAGDSSDAVNKTSDDFHDHIELKRHTSAEIESSGNWYDKKVSIFGTKYGFRFSNAMTQVVMLSFVVFMTPGMFNACLLYTSTKSRLHLLIAFFYVDLIYTLHAY